MTDHNLRYAERTSPDSQRALYLEMKKHGFESIRFDADWKALMPESGSAPQEEIINRYADALKMMKETGLQAPTLVISNPPEWAQKLYDAGDHEAYFKAYKDYMASVAEVLKRSQSSVHALQMFNEINHAVLFKFVKADDLPRLAEIVRETVGKVQPDLRLSTSLILSNTNDALAEIKDPTLNETQTANAFLSKYEDLLKDSFDIISLDYYPGVWHMPLREADESYKGTFKQLGMLQNVCERISSWGKEYEIGEVGYPTNRPWSTEKRQRYFYDTFFRAFRAMLVDFQSRGIRLPSRVGLYETEDEPNISFGGVVEKILKMPGIRRLSGLTPNPEHDFGLRKNTGAPKSILTGRRHKPPAPAAGAGDADELSQMARIIRYVNRPPGSKKEKR